VLIGLSTFTCSCCPSPPFICVLHVCCFGRWQVMLIKRKRKLKEKRRNLWVGGNSFEVITKHSWHFSLYVSFSDFRITSSPGRPAGYVVPNCQTHTSLSLQTLPLYFSKHGFLVLVDLMLFLHIGYHVVLLSSATVNPSFLSISERDLWWFVSRGSVLVHSVPQNSKCSYYPKKGMQ